MTTTQHEYERGKNNAYAIVEKSDIKTAEDWLAWRLIAARAPLTDAYVRGFKDQIAKEKEYVQNKSSIG